MQPLLFRSFTAFRSEGTDSAMQTWLKKIQVSELLAYSAPPEGTPQIHRRMLQYNTSGLLWP